MTIGSAQTMGLGGALKAAVESVVENGAAGISVADAGTQPAFLDAWTRTLTAHARHLRAQRKELSAPVVLVYSENCSDDGARLGWVRRPMFGGSPTDPFGGTVAVGTAEIGAYVRLQPVTNTSDATDALQAAGLGNSLTVALLSTTSLVIWPKGLDSDVTPEIRRELDDAPVVLDLAAIDLMLQQFYEWAGRQPRAWWKERDKLITVEEPEGVVQNDLWFFLMGRYAEIARVKVEPRIGYGRADITFTPINPAHKSAVFELKSTRDFATPQPGTTTPTRRSLKTNIDWARSGVAQTAAYRDDERLDAGYLCVYDFCAGDLKEITQAIEEAAAPYGVIPRRYWITSSNKEHRTSRYPDHPAGGPAVKA
jgi:hypothetical protein